MSHFLLRAAALSAALSLVAISNAQQPLPTLPPPRPAGASPGAPIDSMEPGIQVAQKGPIHEAFAQPGADTRGKDMKAPKAPPPPIPEEPPETKPDGANVHWVPGYWHWDAEKEDFIWVSGFWRNFPAGRDWQAGKWTTNKNGQYHYAPGFWRPTNMNSWRIDLPEPPRSVESGPSTPANDPNSTWIPGAWEFRNEKYVWRAGYWAHPNGNNLWQPGQYVQSGSGYAYVPGFWDYPLEDRGLLYAPVYFDQPLWQTAGWRFRPRLAFGLGLGWGGWGTGGFFDSLWIGPGFNNFCYGNGFNSWGNGFWNGCGSPFWGSAFGIGFGFGSSFCGWSGCRPWWGSCNGFSNPLWNQYCWLNRGNPNWAANVQSATVARAIGAGPRPAVLAGAGATPRQLAISAPGVGGAVQTAARSAALTAAKPQPLIQPASQVARSLQAGRASAVSPVPGTVPGGPGSGGATNLPSAASLNASRFSDAMRPTQLAPPIHAGSVQFTPGTGVGPPTIGAGNAGNLNRPDVGVTTIRQGNAGNFNQPNQLPLQPNNGNAINPGIRMNPQPVIRSGNLPPQSFPSPGVIGGRSGLPSSPGFRPGMPSMGSGRSLPISPSGGRSMGSMGGGRVGGGMGGGGRVGGGMGGGGGRGGGGHR